MPQRIDTVFRPLASHDIEDQAKQLPTVYSMVISPVAMRGVRGNAQVLQRAPARCGSRPVTGAAASRRACRGRGEDCKVAGSKAAGCRR